MLSSWLLMQERARADVSPDDDDALKRWQSFLVTLKGWVGLGRSAANLALESGQDAQKMLDSAKDLF